MSDRATELIERMERETGRRWDDDNPAALYGLLGALAREMGANPHKPEDDVPAGVVIAGSRQIEEERAALLDHLKLTGLVDPET